MTTAMGQLVQKVEFDGIQQGIQQGIKSNSIAIARNLLDIETIAIKTGLTLEEVKQIKKEVLEK